MIAISICSMSAYNKCTYTCLNSIIFRGWVEHLHATMAGKPKMQTEYNTV